MKKYSKKKMEALILELGEWFKEELDFNLDLHDWRIKKYEDYKKRCYEALGNPNMLQADIKEQGR